VLSVIDASAAVQLASSRSGFVLVSHLELIAPPLFWSEAMSALHQGAFRGALDAKSARRSLDVVLGAPIGRREPRRLRARAWEIADELGWAKTYDAEYVALAELNDCPLLTTDARLARSAGAYVRLITPMSG
jgi:predicted nucleic acid-binding protein